METLKLKRRKIIPGQHIQISGSKSISNRLLIMQALYKGILVSNLSDAQDTQLLQEALQSQEDIIDIHHAGTAMRFLTAYYSIQKGRRVILTGSDRMKQRPIYPLVDTLRDLGAEIEYTEQEGFPPLKIKGTQIEKSEVTIDASISSQFITALLLIAPKLTHGLKLHLSGELTSKPYIKMTLKLLKELGVQTRFNDSTIEIEPYEMKTFATNLRHIEVESDWSSASYFYSIAALSKQAFNLRSFLSHSYQGDSVLKELYWNFFGVNTITDDAELTLSLLPEKDFKYPSVIKYNLKDYPDIAQTLCVTAAALQIPFHFTGLKTLLIKETNRLSALKNELYKIGCMTEITDESIRSTQYIEPEENIKIETYNDHRMAMAFAPFCLVKPLEIINPDVVEKSYPKFWTHFSQISAEISDTKF